MRIFLVLFFVTATATASFCSPGGVLEKVAKIRVDPTVIGRPEKVDDPMAASLVRYNLRAAVKDAHFEEGESSTRAFIVLDEFSSESPVRRLIGLGSGRSISTVECRLIIQDFSGKELANVRIHVHGSVAFSPGEGNGAQDRHATSDLKQRLLQEIERLK